MSKPAISTGDYTRSFKVDLKKSAYDALIHAYADHTLKSWFCEYFDWRVRWEHANNLSWQKAGQKKDYFSWLQMNLNQWTTDFLDGTQGADAYIDRQRAKYKDVTDPEWRPGGRLSASFDPHKDDKEVRRMANGFYTNDYREYQESWSKIYEPIERHTGVVCMGFDPQLTFKDGPLGDNVVQLPVAFARKIAEAFLLYEQSQTPSGKK